MTEAYVPRQKSLEISQNATIDVEISSASA